ncbi:MAG TPA: hypothetical protein VE592_07430 [Geminicoccaceae bacterium]|nr:hypothetical protein [Geminicoccaceae bacterium]
MKIALFRASAAVAIVLSLGLTAVVDAEEPAGSGQASVEQPAGAPRDVRATVVTPEGRRQQSATVERQQVPVGDGETVTVLRPVAAGGEKASSQEEDVQRERPLTWQVAAGRRLWLIDPATGDLRTCAVRNTSTVGVEAIRCLAVSGSRFRRTFGP